MVNFPEILPPECASAILSLLCRDDLCQAVRVSSSWRCAVERLLYKHIAIRSADAMMELRHSVESRPYLIDCIRQLSVNGTDPKPALQDATARAVHQLSDLRVLRLSRWPYDLEFVAGHSQLKEITLKEGNPRAMNHVRPLWELPGVESIRACLAEPTGPVDHWPTARKLTKLGLRFCDLSERNLGVLLQASPSLKFLLFDNRYNVGRGTQQGCHDLTCALGHVSDTLEELELSLKVYSSYAEEVEYLRLTPVNGHIGSLKSFRCLRKLKLPIVTLLGWDPGSHTKIADLLPPSLTHLGLLEDLVTQCTYTWEEQPVLERLEEFFKAMNIATPYMKKLEFCPDHSYRRWQRELMDQMQTLCSWAGVECIFHPVRDEFSIPP